MPIFSERLEQSLQRAHTIAGAGHYEYSTLEHLLLALADDEDAAAVLRACNVDIEKLQRNLVSFINSELAKFETGRSENAKPSAAFQRVVQRAVVHARSVGREEVTAANVLVAILTEREGQTSAALEEQAMTRYDATLYICHGIAKADQLSRRRIEAGHRPLAEPSVRTLAVGRSNSHRICEHPLRRRRAPNFEGGVHVEANISRNAPDPKGCASWLICGGHTTHEASTNSATNKTSTK